MSRLEDELRNALRPQQPPAGFADRVLTRLYAEGSRPPHWWQPVFAPFWRRALAGALACLILVGGFFLHHEQQRRREGEIAKEQVTLALRITGTKIHRAQQMVRQINADERSPQPNREGL